MINNIWFQIIAGKINKNPELYTIFAYIIVLYDHIWSNAVR